MSERNHWKCLHDVVMIEQCRGLRTKSAQRINVPTCKFTEKFSFFFTKAGWCYDYRHCGCVCTYVCLCVFSFCMCVRSCMWLCVHVCLCVFLWMRVGVCACIHVCVYSYVSLCSYVHMCVNVHVFVTMCLRWTCSEVIRHSQRCRRGCRICTRCIASDRSSQQPSCSL